MNSITVKHYIKPHLFTLITDFQTNDPRIIISMSLRGRVKVRVGL